MLPQSRAQLLGQRRHRPVAQRCGDTDALHFFTTLDLALVTHLGGEVRPLDVGQRFAQTLVVLVRHAANDTDAAAFEAAGAELIDHPRD